MASSAAIDHGRTSFRSGPRRTNRRASVALPVLVHILGQSHRASLQNLSERGAKIETDARLRRGDELLFRCGAIEVRAKVAWQNGNEAGLEFCTTVSEKDIREQILRGDSLANRRISRQPAFAHA
jgi:hypothetical protein